jgi:hypothetical protein
MAVPLSLKDEETVAGEPPAGVDHDQAVPLHQRFQGAECSSSDSGLQIVNGKAVKRKADA